MGQCAQACKHMMLNRHIEQPLLTYDTPHFPEGIAYLCQVMQDANNEADVESLINERQVVEVGTNQKEMAPLDLCCIRCGGTFEVAKRIVNKDSMPGPLEVVNGVTAKPTSKVDEPPCLSDANEEALECKGLCPLLVRSLLPMSTIVVVVSVIVSNEWVDIGWWLRREYASFLLHTKYIDEYVCNDDKLLNKSGHAGQPVAPRACF